MLPLPFVHHVFISDINLISISFLSPSTQLQQMYITLKILCMCWFYGCTKIQIRRSVLGIFGDTRWCVCAHECVCFLSKSYGSAGAQGPSFNRGLFHYKLYQHVFGSMVGGSMVKRFLVQFYWLTLTLAFLCGGGTYSLYGFSGYSSFLPECQNTHIRLTGDLKLE